MRAFVVPALFAFCEILALASALKLENGQTSRVLEVLFVRIEPTEWLNSYDAAPVDELLHHGETINITVAHDSRLKAQIHSTVHPDIVVMDGIESAGGSYYTCPVGTAEHPDPEEAIVAAGKAAVGWDDGASTLYDNLVIVAPYCLDLDLTHKPFAGNVGLVHVARIQPYYTVASQILYCITQSFGIRQALFEDGRVDTSDYSSMTNTHWSMNPGVKHYLGWITESNGNVKKVGKSRSCDRDPACTRAVDGGASTFTIHYSTPVNNGVELPSDYAFKDDHIYALKLETDYDDRFLWVDYRRYSASVFVTYEGDVDQGYIGPTIRMDPTPGKSAWFGDAFIPVGKRYAYEMGSHVANIDVLSLNSDDKTIEVRVEYVSMETYDGLKAGIPEVSCGETYTANESTELFKLRTTDPVQVTVSHSCSGTQGAYTFGELSGASRLSRFPVNIFATPNNTEAGDLLTVVEAIAALDQTKIDCSQKNFLSELCNANFCDVNVSFPDYPSFSGVYDRTGEIYNDHQVYEHYFDDVGDTLSFRYWRAPRYVDKLGGAFSPWYLMNSAQTSFSMAIFPHYEYEPFPFLDPPAALELATRPELMDPDMSASCASAAYVNQDPFSFGAGPGTVQVQDAFELRLRPGEETRTITFRHFSQENYFLLDGVLPGDYEITLQCQNPTTCATDRLYDSVAKTCSDCPAGSAAPDHTACERVCDAFLVDFTEVTGVQRASGLYSQSSSPHNGRPAYVLFGSNSRQESFAIYHTQHRWVLGYHIGDEEYIYVVADQSDTALASAHANVSEVTFECTCEGFPGCAVCGANEIANPFQPSACFTPCSHLDVQTGPDAGTTQQFSYAGLNESMPVFVSNSSALTLSASRASTGEVEWLIRDSDGGVVVVDRLRVTTDAEHVFWPTDVNDMQWSISNQSRAIQCAADGNGETEDPYSILSGYTLPPTQRPTQSPTTPPPTLRPTMAPTDSPTQFPTDVPTDVPTDAPTYAPTDTPTDAPTDTPTKAPTQSPSDAPTVAPTEETKSFWRMVADFLFGSVVGYCVFAALCLLVIVIYTLIVLYVVKLFGGPDQDFNMKIGTYTTGGKNYDAISSYAY